MSIIAAFLSSVEAQTRPDALVVLPMHAAADLCAELRTLMAEREATKAPDDNVDNLADALKAVRADLEGSRVDYNAAIGRLHMANRRGENLERELRESASIRDALKVDLDVEQGRARLVKAELAAAKAALTDLRAERDKLAAEIAAGAKPDGADAAKADLERQVYLATEAARFFSRSLTTLVKSAARAGIGFETGADFQQGMEHHSQVIGHLTEASSTLAEVIEGTAKGYDAMKAQLADLADVASHVSGYIFHPAPSRMLAGAIQQARALLNG
jgi:hypothetical protein